METSFRSEALKYLHRVQMLYPYGIPLSAYCEDKGSPQALDQTEVAIVKAVFVIGDVDLQEEETALLNAAISKGMKFSLSEIEIIPVTKMNSAEKNTSPVPSLIFGDTAAGNLMPNVSPGEIFGKVVTVKERKVLLTHDVQSILTQPQKKREFWIHLQMLLEELKAR